ALPPARRLPRARARRRCPDPGTEAGWRAARSHARDPRLRRRRPPGRPDRGGGGHQGDHVQRGARGGVRAPGAGHPPGAGGFRGPGSRRAPGARRARRRGSPRPEGHRREDRGVGRRGEHHRRRPVQADPGALPDGVAVPLRAAARRTRLPRRPPPRAPRADAPPAHGAALHPEAARGEQAGRRYRDRRGDPPRVRDAARDRAEAPRDGRLPPDRRLPRGVQGGPRPRARQGRLAPRRAAQGRQLRPHRQARVDGPGEQGARRRPRLAPPRRDGHRVQRRDVLAQPRSAQPAGGNGVRLPHHPGGSCAAGRGQGAPHPDHPGHRLRRRARGPGPRRHRVQQVEGGRRLQHARGRLPRPARRRAGGDPRGRAGLAPAVVRGGDRRAQAGRHPPPVRHPRLPGAPHEVRRRADHAPERRRRVHPRGGPQPDPREPRPAEGDAAHARRSARERLRLHAAV
ncbi:MAG: Survival protein SurA precursor (Peptidyl-prolyl cis-trans isomerase SurA), partial [uncultured Gemmatimonadaceae bacterium]